MAEKKKSDPNAGKTHEQIVEQARRAGIASGVARRRQRDMRNILDDYLSLPMKKGKELETAEAFSSMASINITVGEKIMMAQIKKAINGDTKAAEFIRDTSGQKAPQQIQATVEADPLVDIIKQMQTTEQEEKKDEE